MPYVVTLADGSVLLRLYVQPKAAKSRLIGLHDGCLKVAVASPPLDGRANLEVLHIVADLLGLSGRDVTLRSGARARQKQIIVTGRNEASIRDRVAEALGSGQSPGRSK